MSLAGLWEKWKSPEGKDIETCTILTTVANSMVRYLHDRMPVILLHEEYALWFNRDVDDVKRFAELFHPYPSDRLREYAVSKDMNSSNNDSPGCIVPILQEYQTQEKTESQPRINFHKHMLGGLYGTG